MRSAAERVLERCDALAADSDDAERLTRTYLSPALRRAHQRVRPWMEQAGLRVRLDAAGNLIGRRPGRDPDAGTLWLGSHLDSVVDAGRYDGALGVLAAVEVAAALREEGLPHGLAVVAFGDEEGVRFGRPYLGSAALAGRFDPAWLELRDRDGVSLREALIAFGLEPERLAEAALDRADARGFVELHVEQGPVLERAGLAAAPAARIAGQSRRRLTFRGRAAHAGTTPVALRQDALLGAASLALAAEAHAQEVRGLVATVGRLTVAPNAANVVPGWAEASLDVRHAEDTRRTAATRYLEAEAARLARERGLGLEVETVLEQPSVRLDAELTARLERLTGAAPLTSGAGHDAAILAEVLPSALLFVRSPGGVSHHPDEAARAEDVAAALEAMVRLARAPWNGGGVGADGRDGATAGGARG